MEISDAPAISCPPSSSPGLALESSLVEAAVTVLFVTQDTDALCYSQQAGNLAPPLTIT